MSDNQQDGMEFHFNEASFQNGLKELLQKEYPDMAAMYICLIPRNNENDCYGMPVFMPGDIDNIVQLASLLRNSSQALLAHATMLRQSQDLPKRPAAVTNTGDIIPAGIHDQYCLCQECLKHRRSKS